MGASKRDEKKIFTGVIAWMAQNPVAANLFMLLVLGGGLTGVFKVKQEVFPEFSLDLVTISVPYPGASPAEVEQGIVLAVEEAVRGVDGVKRVTSSSGEGVGTVTVELQVDAEPNQVLADVKTEVDRILTFSEEAEEPVVSLVSRRREVISLIISGDVDLRSLHALGERARHGLLESPDVTQVEMDGVPPLEVSVEISRETLESFGLTLEEVAQQISSASLELPGGGVDTASGEILVRVADRRVEGYEFKDIIIRSTRDGASVRLCDLADVRDGFADTNQASYFNGKPAVRLTAYRVGDETPTQVSRAVRSYADELRAELPDILSVNIWADSSEILQARIDLLVRNAALGFVLVVLVLSLFLELRLAFWVSLGIPISFMGAFFLMPGMDQSINMISLFALIITLGMVVDDAIVVGENAFSKIQEGVPRLQAAILGAREMAMPVTFSILTTVAAFTPLLLVPGVSGKLFKIIPLVVVSVLMFSLIESFLVLPAHLGHGRDDPRRRFTAWFDRLQIPVGAKLEQFTLQGYRPALMWVLRHRALTVSAAVSFLVFSLGLAVAGVIPFSFFPKLEGDRVTASARLPYGAPLERTLEVQRTLEEAANRAVERHGGARVIRGMYSRVGEGPKKGWAPGDVGSHLVTVELNLVPTEERDVTSAEMSDAWTKETPQIAGVDALTFNSSTGPGAGKAVDVQLSHIDARTLAEASNRLNEELRGYAALTNIENTYASGKPQLNYHVMPNARALGLTAGDIARQIRSAFYGAEALREQRGRNEVKVMVRLPKSQRRSEYDLEQLQLRTPSGGLVPLQYVAEFDRGNAPTLIRRESGRRIVNVSAELAAGVKSSRGVLKSLNEGFLPAMEADYPGLSVEFAGQQREQAETFASLGINFLLMQIVIFGLLAVPFRSYVQPLVVMTAIPFGIVGALWGHLLMGYELSLISILGLVALTGVVVNDSLVLIDTTNGLRRAGASAREAIVQAGVRRLRPVFLTSITTFLGLAPMIFETSVQARFLIPMAISLGYGVMFATAIVLLLIPAFYTYVEDARDWWHGKRSSDDEGGRSTDRIGAEQPGVAEELDGVAASVGLAGQ